MPAEHRDVGRALAQRRQAQVDDVEAIEEVLAEAPRLHLAPEVAVADGDDAHVHLERVTAAHPMHLALLQHPEQLGLHGERDLRHFVEDQRAAGGHLEPPRPARHRAGEGAALVTEQLGFHEALGQRRAVDGHVGAALAAGSRRG